VEYAATLQTVYADMCRPIERRRRARGAAWLLIAAACAPTARDPVDEAERLRRPEDTFIVYAYQGDLDQRPRADRLAYVLQMSRCENGVVVRLEREFGGPPGPVTAFYGHCL
jgi:hypothetical protein